MGFVRKITGQDAAKRSEAAAQQAGQLQSDAATDAARAAGLAGQNAGNVIGVAGTNARNLIGDAGAQSGALFDPFAQLGQSGIDQAGFLTDPQAQFDFLQNNPLFQAGLDNANQQTLGLSAARGRLSSGDTLEQLNQNALLTASPLIQQQKQSIGNLLNIGQGAAGNQANILNSTAGNQANNLTNTGLNQANILTNTAANQSSLLTGAAAAQGAGLVGGANARNQGDANLGNLVGQIGGALLPLAGGFATGLFGGTPAATPGIGDVFGGDIGPIKANPINTPFGGR